MEEAVVQPIAGETSFHPLSNQYTVELSDSGSQAGRDHVVDSAGSDAEFVEWFNNRPTLKRNALGGCSGMCFVIPVRVLLLELVPVCALGYTLVDLIREGVNIANPPELDFMQEYKAGRTLFFVVVITLPSLWLVLKLVCLWRAGGLFYIRKRSRPTFATLGKILDFYCTGTVCCNVSVRMLTSFFLALAAVGGILFGLSQAASPQGVAYALCRSIVNVLFIIVVNGIVPFTPLTEEQKSLLDTFGEIQVSAMEIDFWECLFLPINEMIYKGMSQAVLSKAVRERGTEPSVKAQQRLSMRQVSMFQFQ